MHFKLSEHQKKTNQTPQEPRQSGTRWVIQLIQTLSQVNIGGVERRRRRPVTASRSQVATGSLAALIHSVDELPLSGGINQTTTNAWED